MQLSGEFVQQLLGFGAAIGSVCVAIAGAWKFLAWTKDRSVQSQLESGGYLKANGPTPGMVDFASEQLIRIHFARLTSVDVPSGHDGLIRFRQRLHCEDLDWSAIRRVHRFLITRGEIARVRRLSRTDFLWALARLFGGLAAFGGGCTLAVLAVASSMKAHWTDMQLSELALVFNLSAYGFTFIVIGVAWMLMAAHYWEAKRLKVKRLAARKKRHNNQRKSVVTSALGREPRLDSCAKLDLPENGQR